MKIQSLLLLLLLCLLPEQAQAQASVRVCNSAQPQNCLNPQSDGSLNVNATVSTTTNPVGLTPTDRTITSASGSSQQLMAGNASRHSMQIENTGSSNCGVNPTGGTAAIGGAGTITLAPLGSYSPGIPTVSAVTVICTAGQPIYADEN